MNTTNYLLTVVLLFLFHSSFAQQTDYIIDTNDVKIYGKIKGGSPASFSSQVKFKTDKSKVKRYGPTDLKEWGKGELLYLSKIYRPNKKKPIPVFMRQISPKEGVVQVFEFYNTLGKKGITQTFLEKNGVLTKVNFGNFRQQMLRYFGDKKAIKEIIAGRDARKKDLVALVAEYNDLVEEQVAETVLQILHDNNSSSPPLWNLDDMLLNPIDAAHKYTSILEKENNSIRNKQEKKIALNYRIGSSFFAQKQYENAIPYFNKALEEILASQLSKEIKPRIEAMLATIYINLREYDLAIRHNSNALSDWKNGFSRKDDLMNVHKAYLNQGLIFENIEPKEVNTKWYEKSVKSSQKNWKAELEKRGISPINHSTNPEKIVDYNLALLSYKNAQALVGQFSKKQRIQQEIATQLAIAALFFTSGDYSHAKDYYEKALEQMKKNYTSEYPKIAETTRILSEICLADQLYSEAFAYIEQAQKLQVGSDITIDHSLLANIKKVPFPFELLNFIVIKGIILYQNVKDNNSEKDLKEVLAHFDIATKLLNKLRYTHRNEGADFRLSNITLKFSQQAIITCNALYEITKNDAYLHEAFIYAELSKSAVLFESIHDLKSMKISGIPRAQLLRENGLKVQIAYLKGEVFYELQQDESKSQARLKALQDKITTISREHNALIKSFEQNYEDYYNLKYNYKSVSLKELQQELSSDEVFLEYVATNSFVYVLAIDKEKVKGQFVHLKEPLHQIVKKLQHALVSNKATLFKENGQLLYKAVVGELGPFIQNKKLIIAPDAELHYIPFGVLPSQVSKSKSKGHKIYKETRFLIEDHPICYNYSASLYILSKSKRNKHPTKKIATWAPNFDLMDEIIKDKGIGNTLSSLPGAEQEANAIANMFMSKAYIAEEASEAQFKKLAGQYSVLHIATHGVLNDLNPLFSSLIMNNNEEEDGILHAFELYNMRLNADLAVLSACNSGMGKLTKCEGIASIARGFSYAGVPNIVMSKWPVSDWTTEVLMKDFYKNLKAGIPKDEALQQAKIKYLHDNKDKSGLLAPFYWGGFVLSGNTNPIEALIIEKINYSTYLFLAGLIVLLIAIVLFFKQRRRLSAKSNSNLPNSS